MASEFPPERDPEEEEEEVAELEEQKEEQVLHREPVEQELMQAGVSELGTEIDGTEDVE